MTVWRMVDPRNPAFAHVTCTGAWSQGQGLCRTCTGSTQRRIPPAIVEWEGLSGNVGDWTWSLCGACVLLSVDVHRSLARRFSGYKVGPVKIIANKQGVARDRGCTTPEEGGMVAQVEHRFYEMWLTKWVHLVPEISTATMAWKCPECGRERWEVTGVEICESRFDRRKGTLVPAKRKRLPGHGLFVHRGDLDRADFFGVSEFPGWYLCTDRARDFMRSMKYTNIAFLEYGALV